MEDHKRFPLMVETPLHIECTEPQSEGNRDSNSRNSKNSRCSWEPDGFESKKTTQ